MESITFAMRLFYNDSYQLDLQSNKRHALNSDEVKDLHSTHCQIFPARKIRRTPVLRFFGQTKRGQKACLNIFDYFPYFFVELPELLYVPGATAVNQEAGEEESKDLAFLIYFAQCLEISIYMVVNSMREVNFEKVERI